MTLRNSHKLPKTIEDFYLNKPISQDELNNKTFLVNHMAIFTAAIKGIIQENGYNSVNLATYALESALKHKLKIYVEDEAYVAVLAQNHFKKLLTFSIEGFIKINGFNPDRIADFGIKIRVAAMETIDKDNEALPINIYMEMLTFAIEGFTKNNGFDVSNIACFLLEYTELTEMYTQAEHNIKLTSMKMQNYSGKVKDENIIDLTQSVENLKITPLADSSQTDRNRLFAVTQSPSNQSEDIHSEISIQENPLNLLKDIRIEMNSLMVQIQEKSNRLNELEKKVAHIESTFIARSTVDSEKTIKI